MHPLSWATSFPKRVTVLNYLNNCEYIVASLTCMWKSTLISNPKSIHLEGLVPKNSETLLHQFLSLESQNANTSL